jgi:hypothetical protein
LNTEKQVLKIRIIGHNLQGLQFDKRQGALINRQPVYLGIHRKARVIDLVPADARKAEFKISIDVVKSSNESLDFRGPFVRGRRGDRFLFLSWGEVDGHGVFSMFRRATLHLSAIKQKDALRALCSNSELEASVNLTDEKGGPICGKIDAEKTIWKIRRTSSAAVN